MNKLIWILILLLGLSACRGKYIASMFTSDSYQKTELTKNVRKLVKPERYWQIAYTLDVPKEGLRVEGKVKIVRDSLILMSVKKLGIEAMRIQLTRDSVWILDRLKKKYFEGSYANFEKFAKIPFDFFLCQAVFLNEPYLDLVRVDNAQVTDSLLLYSSTLIKKTGRMDINQSYFLDPVYLQGFVFSSEAIHTEGEIVYDYAKKYKMKGFYLKTTNPNLPSAYFKTKDVDTKNRFSIRFKIPKRYEKMHFN